MKSKQALLFSFALFIFASISGCVNVDQKTTFNKDGSGTIALHYWTPSGYVSTGDIVGGMVFYEPELKNLFSSDFFEVTESKRESFENDTTTHIRVNINFKDFNKISDVKGFEKVTGSYIKDGDNYIFKYTVKKDTTLPKTMKMDIYSLNFSFEFPGEVIATNGTVNEKTVTWKKTVADLKEDIEMTATINTKPKMCGLFGFELPVIIFSGLLISVFKRRLK